MHTIINTNNFRNISYILISIAALFMFMPIHIQFIGEESVYAVFMQQMLESNDYINAFYRPPLFLWITILLEKTFHFSSIDIPLRVTSILFSLSTAGFSALFAHKVFQHANAGIIAALTFLTLGEIQFWYGWLGYADATLLFFVFASTSSIWMAAQFKQIRWYALAILFMNCAFLTKAVTVYAFFFTTLLIVAIGFNSWRFFLRPTNILLTSLVFLAPAWWIHTHGAGASSTSNSLIYDIMMRFTTIDPVHYIKHIIQMPLELFARMAPMSLLLLWYAYSTKTFSIDKPTRLMMLIFTINFLPYWLAPFSNMRHCIPLFAWGSMLLTYYLLQYGSHLQIKALKIIAVVLILKIPFSFWGLPLLKEKGKDHAFYPVAQEINTLTNNGTPLRQLNDSFVGFAVTAYINEMREPKPYIKFYSPADHNVYVLAYNPIKNGKLIKKYVLFGSPLLLVYVP